MPTRPFTFALDLHDFSGTLANGVFSPSADLKMQLSTKRVLVIGAGA